MKKFILFCLMAVLQQGYAQEALEGYFQLAAENNAGLRASFNQYLARLEQLPQAAALPDPQAAFQFFVLPVETRLGAQRAGLSASQMFPWFGTLEAKEQAAAKMAEASYQQFVDARLQLHYQLSMLYYDAYQLEAAIRLNQEYLQRLASIKNLANIKLEAGKTRLADLLRIDMEINAAEEQLAKLQDDRLPLRARFEALLNQPLGGPIALPDTLWQASWLMSMDSLSAKLQRRHPRLQALHIQQQAWAFRAEAAQKEGMPSFMLGAGYVNVSARSDAEIPSNGRDIFQTQVGVRIPLSRKKYRAKVKEAELYQQAVADTQSNLARQLIAQVAKGYNDYRDAHRRLELYRKQIVLTRKSFDLLIQEYAVADSDFEDLLRMDQKLLRFTLELEKARVDLNKSVAFLQYLSGE